MMKIDMPPTLDVTTEEHLPFIYVSRMTDKGDGIVSQIELCVSEVIPLITKLLIELVKKTKEVG